MRFASLRRVTHILLVLVKHGLSHFAGPLVRRSRWLARRLPATCLSGPVRSRMMAEDLGGAFLKLGQMLAMQPDILPFEYCNALYDLLDHVTPLPAADIIQVIADDLGAAPEILFDRFDQKPLASGSIGQVHVAWRGGRKLAIKVQRPDAKANFDRDVKLMRLCVWLIRHLHLRPLDFMLDPLTEFADWIRDELDFRREAGYMRELRRDSDGSHRQYVPDVLTKFTTRRILVVEYLDGVTLLDHLRSLAKHNSRHEARLQSLRFNPEQVARNIIDNYLGDVFEYGLFHADLHPANLIILADNVVGYIDFGITGVISRYSRQNLLSMTLAYARNDIDALCDRFFSVSSVDESSDPQAFRERLKQLSEHWYARDAKDTRLQTSTTQVMLDMLRLSRQTRIWPQRDIIKYIRSAIAIDGLVRRFAPGFDFGHYLGTACRRHLTWHARKIMLSHDALVNSTHASVDLMRDGMFRMAAAFENVTEKPHRSRQAAPRSRRRSRSRLAINALLFVICGMALWLAGGTHVTPFRVGLNLASAELLVAAGAALLLIVGRRPALALADRRHTEN